MIDLFTSMFGSPPYEYFQQQFQNNEMFIALIGGMAFGSLLYLVRYLGIATWKSFMAQFIVRVQINNDNSMYNEFLAFLVVNGIVSPKTKKLIIDREVSLDKSNFDKNDTPFSSDKIYDDVLTIGEGYHFLWYKKNLMIIHHTIGEPKMMQRAKSIDIITVGRTNKFISDLVSEISEMRNEKYKNSVTVNHYSSGFWDSVSKKEKRDLSTIVLNSNQKEELINDITWFTQNNKWYANKGIPYRRGYLLYGPPGTGKTSLVFGIASHFNLDIYLLNLSTIGNDNQLIDALSGIVTGSIVLIEDIDVAGVNLNKRTDEEKDSSDDLLNDNSNNKVGVSLSGLLNSLDGVISPSQVMIFMTTNHPNKIDSALLRPGRVDRKELIGYPGHDEVYELFNNFYDNEELANKFANVYDKLDKPMTPAELQEICLRCRDNPENAIACLDSDDRHVAKIKSWN